MPTHDLYLCRCKNRLVVFTPETRKYPSAYRKIQCSKCLVAIYTVHAQGYAQREIVRLEAEGQKPKKTTKKRKRPLPPIKKTLEERMQWV